MTARQWNLFGWVCALVCLDPLSSRAQSTPTGFEPLFDGRTLDGWEGDANIWKVEDGMIVADTPGLPKNAFLATTRSFRDFALRVRFRLVKGVGNSGIQLRSERIPDHHEMIGYQADIGEEYWGCLYDESRRNRVLASPAPGQLDKLRKDDWNEYLIRCMGNRLQMFLNGIPVVDYVEPDATIPRSGRIAVQVHGSPNPVRVEFSSIDLQEMPIARPAAPELTGFLRRSLLRPEGNAADYVVHLPADYHGDANRLWPAILFLHGSGERGADGELPTKVGLGPAIIRRPGIDFIAIFPQAVETWEYRSNDQRHADAILRDVVSLYRVDSDRIHLTGLSMGGAGAYQWGVAEPDRWASMSYLCASVDADQASALSKLPVWSTVGDGDRPGTVSSMQQVADALLASRSRIIAVELPGVGHNCWDHCYGFDELYDWMRRQARSQRAK